jgi:uncharacterized damage-inducible protein DinB
MATCLVRSIDDFVGAWQMESAFTQKVLDALTDASLAQKVTPSGRSLGFLAWHVVQTIPEMLGQAGIPATGPGEHEPQPKSARAIADAYKKAAASVGPALKKAWADAEIDGMIPMYGQQWPRGGTLLGFMMHQAHHRGQMTVLMRQAGLKVPGTYGPAQEEWAAMGMQPQP